MKVLAGLGLVVGFVGAVAACDGSVDGTPTDGTPDPTGTPGSSGSSALPDGGGTDAGEGGSGGPDAGPLPWPRPGACPSAVLDTAGPPAPHTKGSTCAALGYYAYVPPGYTTQSNLPLLVAFHGDGERGNGTSELTKLLDTGMMRAVKDDAWDPQHRFVVLAPQMDDRGGLGERTGASVKAFLDFAIANYAVDVKRVYLTGLSGGGAPIYNYMGDFQGAGVAATNIVCGWYSSQGKECLWKDVPVWYFHGDSDGVVPAGSHSTPSYNNLVACSPAPTKAPRYTMYKGVGHNAWSMTYDLSGMNATNYPIVSSPPGTTPYDVSLYDWFLQHAR